MIKKTRSVLAVFLLVLGSGCAFTPHEVQMSAAVPRMTSDIGKGITVGLRIIDDRDSSTVGQRGVGMQGADVSANALIPHIERQTQQLLSDKGFKVVGYNDNTNTDAKLTVSMRAFKFFIETGFWTGANNVEVILKSEARNDAEDYVNTYRFNTEERMLVVPDGAGIDDMLNSALLDVFTQMAADGELFEFLANKP